MFGWLKKTILNASADSMKRDLERFIVGLEGADGEEIAPMVVTANVIRLNMIAAGRIPAAALDISIPRDSNLAYQCDMCSLYLVGAVAEFQKMGQPSDAAGVMILLHSVRALNVPELRAHGRRMWAQLKRGFPHADTTLSGIRELTGMKLLDGIENELYFIPRGLEPRA